MNQRNSRSQSPPHPSNRVDLLTFQARRALPKKTEGIDIFRISRERQSHFLSQTDRVLFRGNPAAFFQRGP
jgi:hypothetical protein